MPRNVPACAVADRPWADYGHSHLNSWVGRAPTIARESRLAVSLFPESSSAMPRQSSNAMAHLFISSRKASIALFPFGFGAFAGGDYRSLSIYQRPCVLVQHSRRGHSRTPASPSRTLPWSGPCLGHMHPQILLLQPSQTPSHFGAQHPRSRRRQESLRTLWPHFAPPLGASLPAPLFPSRDGTCERFPAHTARASAHRLAFAVNTPGLGTEGWQGRSPCASHWKDNVVFVVKECR